MANWKTDGDLEAIAEAAAAKIIEAMQAEDLDVGKQLGGDQSGLTDVARSFAAEFTTLDPAALTEEYERVQGVAGTTGDGSSILDDLRLSDKFLANWHGDASEEFVRQVARVEAFMSTQCDNLGRALQGLDAAYMVNVEARQSFYDICTLTIQAAEEAIKTGDAKEKKAVVTLLADIPMAIFDIGAGRSLTATIGSIYTIGKDLYELLSITGTAMEVANGFGKHFEVLQAAYKESLNGVAKQLENAGQTMRAKEVELLEPLPAKYTDIHSPDFSYDNFFSGERDKGSFGDEVEKEAKDSPEDEKEDDSDIARALDDSGNPDG
jgi:uncharacterized protein YukE